MARAKGKRSHALYESTDFCYIFPPSFSASIASQRASRASASEVITIEASSTLVAPKESITSETQTVQLNILKDREIQVERRNIY